MRIVIGGALANKPHNGGEAWVRLSWIRGLQQLGHEVTFVECLPPPAGGQEEAIRYWVDIVRRYGLIGRASLLRADASGRLEPGAPALAGLRLPTLRDRVRGADWLINISGHVRDPRLLESVAARAYLDLDPGYTQLWHAGGTELGIGTHDAHFSVGANLGQPRCPIPTSGITWEAVRQPVTLSDWPVAPLSREAPFTTVASWRGSFGPVELDGRMCGTKAHSFRQLLDLPGQIDQPFRLALAIHPGDDADRSRLLAAGWKLVSPDRVSTPSRFRDFVRDSIAEFSPAQGVYVDGRSGWFSDRTVRYLASGRAAIVEDTGHELPDDPEAGLLTFGTRDEAARACLALLEHPRRHAEAARGLAETWFDSARVLPDFLNRAEAARTRPMGVGS